MLYGQPYGCYWGDPEDFVTIIDAADFITGAVVKFKPIPDYPQYFQLVIDGKNAGVPIYVEGDVQAELKGSYAFPGNSHLVTVLGQGQVANQNFDATFAQILFGEAHSDHIQLEIAATPTLFSYEQNGASQFSSWNISGIKRFSNCRAATLRPTWGEIDLTLSTNGGVHTLTLSLQGYALATGTITGDGTITLTASNSSGISGTVALTYANDFTVANGSLICEFPSKYNLYYKIGTAWIGNDFPAGLSYAVTGASWLAGVATITIGAHLITVGTTITVSGITPSGYNQENVIVTAVTATAIKFALTDNPGVYVSGGTVERNPSVAIVDDGHSASYSYTSDVLANGTWYIVVHQINSEGKESSGTTNSTVTVNHVPAAPTNLALSTPTGDVVSWTASTDATSTYNIYDSLSGGVLPHDPTTTHIAGAGTLTQSLAALAGFTGTRYVLVKSLLAGVESGNGEALAITYLAGVALLVRPNIPIPGQQVTTVGRALTVDFSFDTRQQLIAATQIQLFAKLVGTAIDYTTELAHVDISSLDLVALRYYGSVTGTVAADGEYIFAIRATSANGQSLNTDTYGPVRLATALPNDPVIVARGA